MTEAEQYVREFAETFTTPNVLRAVILCEIGIIPWADVAELFKESLIETLLTITAEAN